MKAGRDRPEIGSVGKIGVYAPDGLAPSQIISIADMLENNFDVSPYLSRQMARAILFLVREKDSKVS